MNDSWKQSAIHSAQLQEWHGLSTMERCLTSFFFLVCASRVSNMQSHSHGKLHTIYIIYIDMSILRIVNKLYWFGSISSQEIPVNSRDGQTKEKIWMVNINKIDSFYASCYSTALAWHPFLKFIFSVEQEYQQLPPMVLAMMSVENSRLFNWWTVEWYCSGLQYLVNLFSRFSKPTAKCWTNANALFHIYF